MREVWSVVGKILYVLPLVKDGKYNVSHLLKLNSQSEDGELEVVISEKEVNQLKWWYIFLKYTNGKMKIPRPAGSPKAWSRMGDSDAAGGSKDTVVGAGLGVVVGSS